MLSRNTALPLFLVELAFLLLSEVALSAVTTSSPTTDTSAVSALECYDATDDGKSYRGFRSTTEDGYPCQYWFEQAPHRHSRTVENYPLAGLEKNYCRNPDNEDKPWCYSTDPNIRWQYCRISPCTPEGGARDQKDTRPVWYLHCNNSESVTQAVGTNFSVTLVSACNVYQPRYGCEIAYTLSSAANRRQKITVVVDEGNIVTGERAENDLTYYYAYTINKPKTVTFNLTIASSAQPAVVHLTSQFQYNCERVQSIASIQFKDEA